MVLANSFAQDTLEWKSVIKREFISHDQFNRATGDRFHTILKEREFEEYSYLLEDGGALCFGSSDRVTCFLLPETQPEQQLIEEITQLDLDEDAHSEFFLKLSSTKGGYSETGNDSWGETREEIMILDTLHERILWRQPVSVESEFHQYSDEGESEEEHFETSSCEVGITENAIQIFPCTSNGVRKVQYAKPGLYRLKRGVLSLSIE